MKKFELKNFEKKWIDSFSLVDINDSSNNTTSSYISKYRLINSTDKPKLFYIDFNTLKKTL